MNSQPDGPCFVRPQAMFKTLRRLHGHNLEHQGLNNLSEAFQTFVTRAKFFSLGRLRRTWSHSAVEFMKYRRLLPMLVADEHDAGSAFDDFNLSDHRASLSARPAKQEDRRITVMNVANRATASQIQSFFTKFGKVQSCHIPSEDRRQTMYATLPKNPKKCFTVHIKFKDEQSAQKAKRAMPDELTFYGQEMKVTSYIPTGARRRTISTQNTSGIKASFLDGFGAAESVDGITLSTGSPSVSGVAGDSDAKVLSRSSSTASISSSGTLCSTVDSAATAFALFDEMPTKVLERVFTFIDPIDRIRLERVNKSWLEAAAKAWSHCEHLGFSGEYSSGGRSNHKLLFNNRNPLRNSHLRAFLRRCGPHLKSLDVSGTTNLLDDAALEDIAQQCPNLLELDLSGVSASPNALRSLSESLLLLRRISYRGMHNSGERHFWSLFKANSKTIRHVDLRGCTQLRGRCFKLFGGELEEILLDGCRRIDDEVIEDICARFTALKVLRLDGCDQLTDESISLISRHLLDLKELSLCGDRFSKITSNSLLNLARLESLKSISFDYNSLVTGQLIEALAGIPSLRKFSIGFAGSDASIKEESLLRLADLKELVEVDVSGIAAVNNKVFSSLVNSCRSLVKVSARSCSYLGDEGVEAIICSQKGPLPLIEHIDLSGCILVSCKPVQAIVSAYSECLDGKKPKLSKTITLVVGGTICEPHQIRGAAGSAIGSRRSRVHVDFTDYSALSLDSIKHFFGPTTTGREEVDEDDGKSEDVLSEDDEFGLLSAHRSFIADALNSEDDSPMLEANGKSVLEWAEREAAQLGLLEQGNRK